MEIGTGKFGYEDQKGGWLMYEIRVVLAVQRPYSLTISRWGFLEIQSLELLAVFYLRLTVGSASLSNIDIPSRVPIDNYIRIPNIVGIYLNDRRVLRLDDLCAIQLRFILKYAFIADLRFYQYRGTPAATTARLCRTRIYYIAVHHPNSFSNYHFPT